MITTNLVKAMGERPHARGRWLGVAVAGVCLIGTGLGSATASASTTERVLSGPSAQAAMLGAPLPAGSFGAPTTQKVTISIDPPGGEGGTNVLATQYVIKAFEAKYPNITVKLLSTGNVSSAEWGTVVSGSNPPDIVDLTPIASYYSGLISNHILAPLNDLWQATDMPQRALSAENGFALGPNGTHYMVESQAVLYGMVYYNESLFQKAGLTVPANHRVSLAYFAKMVAALHKIGVQAVGLAGGTTYEDSWLVDALLPTATTSAQMANYLSNYQAKVPETVNYHSAPFMNVLNTLSSWNKANVFQSGYLGVSTGTEAEDAWYEGRIAMNIDGSWEAAAARQAVKFSLGWFLLPSLGVRQTQLTAGLDGVVAIPAKSQNIGAAKLFLSFWLTNAMETQAVVHIESNLPVVNLPPADLSSMDPLVRQMAADAQTNGIESGWASSVPDVQATVNTELQAMFAGSATPAAVASAVQATVNQLR